MLKDIKCPLCKNQKSCAIMGISDYAVEKCGMFNPIEKPIRTNADKIRSMSDEEMAEFICKTQYREGDVCPPTHECAVDKSCEKCWLDWLRKEAKS